MKHAPHPKCAECKKALFKAFDGPWNGNAPPKVTPTMPYVFCRNIKGCNRARGQSIGVGRALETLKKNVKGIVKATPKEKPLSLAKQKERLPGETPKAYWDRVTALEAPGKLKPNASKAEVAAHSELAHEVIERLAKRSVSPVISRKTLDGEVKALKRKAVPKPTKPVDNNVVSVARERVAKLLKAFGNEIGLVLALANQELGNNAVANALIDEYALTEKFGLEKF